MAVRGAVKSAIADGKVSDEEREMIDEAAKSLSKAKRTKLSKALDSGKITDEVEKILQSLDE